MSGTATATADPHHARPRVASARPHLVLVPAGATAMRAARSSEPVMRLTRFGCLILALVMASALTAGGLAVAHHLTSASALSVAPGVTITVKPGETLSQIAARRLPDRSIVGGVLAIQLANGLSASQIHAGQTLSIPAG